MSETLRYFDQALLFSAPLVCISMLYTRPWEFKKPDSGIARRCFADRQKKTANSPVECTVDFRDCNSSRRAIWSGPYDECRICRVCEWRGKMRVVSFSAGIFHRFRRAHECASSESHVLFFSWKRYLTFRPRGWFEILRVVLLW